MQEDFEAAAERIKPVTGPNNEEMLQLYGLYKQATIGDNNTRESKALLWAASNARLSCLPHQQHFLLLPAFTACLQPSQGCWT